MVDILRKGRGEGREGRREKEGEGETEREKERGRERERERGREGELERERKGGREGEINRWIDRWQRQKVIRIIKIQLHSLPPVTESTLFPAYLSISTASGASRCTVKRIIIIIPTIKTVYIKYTILANDEIIHAKHECAKTNEKERVHVHNRLRR